MVNITCITPGIIAAVQAPVMQFWLPVLTMLSGRLKDTAMRMVQAAVSSLKKTAHGWRPDTIPFSATEMEVHILLIMLYRLTVLQEKQQGPTERC
jgi:hypothetical protein